MRVTLVSPFDPHPRRDTAHRAHVGGVERVFAEVSRRLARRGHDVTVACSTDDAPGRAEQDGVRVVRARRRATVLRAPVAGLHRHLDADADVIHVAATYPFTTPAVLRQARRLGVRSVLDFHFEPAPGSLVGRAAAAAYRRIGPRAYDLADVVVVRSLAYAHSAPSLDRVDATRLRVVPNGVDTDTFRPDPDHKPAGHLLFVGRLVPYKGLHNLLRALEHVPDAPPLVVAGDGPLRADLEATARRHGVDAHFLGRVHDHALPALYRDAGLTVLPSVTRQEAFGITLLESMASGTPVVASDLPGVADVAREGGLVARTGDPFDLAARLKQALQPGALPRGEPLARRIQDTYSWDAVTDRLLAVYEELAPNGDAGRATALPTRETPDADPRRHPVL